VREASSDRQPSDSVTCVLALGSNLGDRRGHLLGGLRRLRDSGCFLVDGVSRVVESDPWGPVAQDSFLNLLVQGRSSVSPSSLLRLLQKIEAEEERTPTVRFGPRTLDINIIFFGDLVLATPSLTLPHPRWRERPFVYELLMDVAGCNPPGTFPHPGVEEALLPGRPMSSGLREVEPIAREEFPLHQAEVR